MYCSKRILVGGSQESISKGITLPLKPATDINCNLDGSQKCAGNCFGKGGKEEERRTGQLGIAIVSSTNRERLDQIFHSNPLFPLGKHLHQVVSEILCEFFFNLKQDNLLFITYRCTPPTCGQSTIHCGKTPCF